jgi:hypothetical protein
MQRIAMSRFLLPWPAGELRRFQALEIGGGDTLTAPPRLAWG